MITRFFNGSHERMLAEFVSHNASRTMSGIGTRSFMSALSPSSTSDNSKMAGHGISQSALSDGVPQRLEDGRQGLRQSTQRLTITIDAAMYVWGRAKISGFGFNLMDMIIGPMTIFTSLWDLGLDAPFLLYDDCYTSGQVSSGSVATVAERFVYTEGGTLSVGRLVCLSVCPCHEITLYLQDTSLCWLNIVIQGT
jgi:hypothetical protein